MSFTGRRSVDYRVDPFDLHLFAAVVERGTITAAAQAANLSLSAASARLKALEEVAGVRLLDRTKTGAAPTDAGRVLALHAHRVLVELESMHGEMARFGKGLRGTVRLLCNTAAVAEILPRSLGRFLLTNPDVDLEVEELSSDSVLGALHRGVADIGIVADYVDTTGLMVHPWHEDRLVALCPRRWIAGSRRAIAYRDLLSWPQVGLTQDSGLSRFLTIQSRRSGLTPRFRVRLGDFAAVANMVASGVGVAVVPERAALRLETGTARALKLTDAWARRRLLICVTPSASQRSAVQALVESLALSPAA